MRRYSPDLIREVTEFNAREYYQRMGLKYPYPRRNNRHRLCVGGIRQESADRRLAEQREIDEPTSLVTESDDAGAEPDDEEFRKEKIFDFELLDDDEEEREGAEKEKQAAEDRAYNVSEGLAAGVVEDEGMDEESDDEDDDEEVMMDQPTTGGVFDPAMEALSDPLYNPELSSRITPQDVQPPSIASGLMSTFYVPPPDPFTMPVRNPTTCDENLAPTQQSEQHGIHEYPLQQASSSSVSLNRKFMVFHRPVLSLPPPRLITIKPASLKGYNVDPVHAGRGTPSIRERREAWAGGCLPFTVNRPCPHDSGRASATSSMNMTMSAAETSTEVANNVDGNDVDYFVPCVTTYYAYENGVASASTSDNLTTAEEIGSTPTLVRQMSDETVTPSPSSSMIESTHPVDESAVSVVGPEEATTSSCGEEHSACPDDDTVFGDCVGSCCMSEKRKGKRRAVDVDMDRKGERRVEEQIYSADVVLGGYVDQQIPGEEDRVSSPSFHQCESGASTSSGPPEQEQAKHLMEMSSETHDRIPLRRRAVFGRSEILKVYAPLERILPAMLPLARRPPRPLPLEENPVLRANGLPYHPVTPYSWEQVAVAVDILAYQGMDARSWMTAYNSTGSNAALVCNTVVTGSQVQPTFNSSSSELSAALG